MNRLKSQRCSSLTPIHNLIALLSLELQIKEPVLVIGVKRILWRLLTEKINIQWVGKGSGLHKSKEELQCNLGSVSGAMNAIYIQYMIKGWRVMCINSLPNHP